MALNKGIATLLQHFESIDPAIAEQEYKGFIKFIQNLQHPTRSHAASFLYPFYVYIYIYLLAEELIKDAKDFFLENVSLFTKSDGYSEAVNCLFNLKTIRDIKENSYFNQFCENKYVIKVSEDSLKQILTFLTKFQSKWLLTILYTHFHVEGINVHNNQSSEESSIYKSELPEPKINQPISPTSISSTRSNKTSTYFFIVDENEDSLCCAAFSKTNALACGFSDSTVKLWTSILDSGSSQPDDERTDLNSEKFLSPEFEKTVHCSNPDIILDGHDGSVFGMTFTPGNELLMTCSEDTTVRAWDLKNYEDVAVYSEHKYPVFDIDVSCDSSYFATASQDKTACLWCFDRTTPLRIYSGHSSDVDCVKFNLNGRYLATASLDKSIRLWTVQDARTVRHFAGHDAPISCITFSSNGLQLASADDKGCIKIWDLGSGKRINEIQAHDSRILSLDYNINGTLLASAGFDNYLNVWNVQACLDHPIALPETSESVGDFPNIGLSDRLYSESTFHHLQFSKNTLFSVVTPFNL